MHLMFHRGIMNHVPLPGPSQKPPGKLLAASLLHSGRPVYKDLSNGS